MGQVSPISEMAMSASIEVKLTQMKPGHGYVGKILHVDLTSKNLWTEEPGEEWYRLYWGGSALGVYHALRLIPPGADPLGPENVLIFAISPLTGVPVAGNSRLTVTALSPLTGAIGDSQSGGFLPAEMKFAGFDAVVIRGKASKPVYLWLHDGEAELRPAEHIWGKVTGETEDILRRELGDPQIQIAEIGPAGEKMVRFSAIMHMANRANGRAGLGAVMGSKNLKAIAVRGHGKPAVADPKGIKRLIAITMDRIRQSRWAQSLSAYGTAGTLSYQNSTGGLLTNNYTSGKRMKETILQRMETCFACPIACKPVVKVESGPWKVDPRYGGPEYETLAAFGSYCGVSDLGAIAKANELCSKYGVDTISCGATVAWAMEAYQNGFIRRRLEDGLERLRPHFGDTASMLRLMALTLTREGIGDLLAEGPARAARAIGPEAEELLAQVKRRDAPAHMPQIKRSLGVIYAVNAFGADHNPSAHDSSHRPRLKKERPERLAELGITRPQPMNVLNDEKIRFALRTQYFYSAMDILNVCQFVFGVGDQPFGPKDLVGFARATTGWDVTTDELMKLGARRISMMRMFNVRHGIGPEEDRLSRRMLRALVGGAADGTKLGEEEIANAVRRYYEIAGWDEMGVPKPETLDALGLGWLEESSALLTVIPSPNRSFMNG